MTANWAVSTALFDGYPMALAFAEIASAGGRRVEPAFIAGYIDFSEADFSEHAGRKLASQAADAGVTIAALSAHMDLGGPDVGTLLRLEKRIRFAAVCGSPVLITNAGLSRDVEQIAQRIEAVLPLCEELGITLALENPGHGTGALIQDARSGQRFIARFDHALICLNYDTGNVYSYSGGVRQPNVDLELSGLEGIGHVHLKDLRAESNDWTFCAIGAGSVDHGALLNRLPAELPISLELPLRLYRPRRGDPVRSTEPLPLPALRKALRDSMHAVRIARIIPETQR